MIGIYIQKSWLDTIGDMKDVFFFREKANNHIMVIAGKVQVNYPFLEAKLARKQATDSGEVFLAARIPTGLVSGTFDLTEGETSEYGFVPPKKKRN